MTTREEDRAAWWEAYCAALGGAWANESVVVATDNHHKASGENPAKFLARQMAEMADAALAARKASWPEEETPI
jgi:hypothetical protein